MRKYTKQIVGVVLCGLLAACGASFKDSAPSSCVEYGAVDRMAELYGMSPRYRVTPSLHTPKGVRIDPSSNQIDLQAFDDLIDRIEQCWEEQFGSEPIPRDIARRGYCVDGHPRVRVPRQCITIKIPDEGEGWWWGKSGSQVLRWRADDSACVAKGRPPPCYWRSGMQDGHTIVTTPDAYLFADWFIRVFYGCWNPWGHQIISKCAQQGRLL